MNEPQPPPVAAPKQGMAVTSLVLGLISLVPCLPFLTGIPAIILGHIAHGRARRQPLLHGGTGLALAGLILGYVSLPYTLVSASLMLPALARAKARAQSISCVSNLKQIALSSLLYANDHNGTLPPDFKSMANELVIPKILVCPADPDKTAAPDFSQFDPSQNLSYEFLTPGAKRDQVLSQVILRCRVHENEAMGDGSGHQRWRSARPRQ